MSAPKPASVMDRTLSATPTSIKPIPSSSNAPEDVSRQRSSTLSDIFRYVRKEYKWMHAHFKLADGFLCFLSVYTLFTITFE